MRMLRLPVVAVVGTILPGFLLFLVTLQSKIRLSVATFSGILPPPVQRLDMRPTASIAEERQRRRLKKASIHEDPPKIWFHPRVRAVYATLHPPSGDGMNDTVEARVYHEFVQYRHLSRYERKLRFEHGEELHAHWHGNYTHMPWPAVTVEISIDSTISDVNISSAPSPAPSDTNLTSRIRRQLQPNDKSLLLGGQYNHYQGIPLSQGYGTHYVHLWVGSPIPQRQSVIVDTGSHFTAFPCVGCQDCGQEHHTDPYFDPGQSQTFHSLLCPSECQEHATCSAATETKETSSINNPTSFSSPANRCHFTQSYTEGSSWKAYQARDVLYAGGPDVLEAANPLDRQYSLPFMFGCLQHETGLFITQLADGIMGMSAHETTLPKQLYNKGKLEYNMFAMCFRKEMGTSKRGVTAGSMTLGGVSSTLDISPMVFARNTQPYGWFTVYVQNIYVAKNGGTQFLLDHTASDELLQSIVRVPVDVVEVNSGKGVIVDSGTTDTYLNANAMPAFVKVWKQVTGMEYTHSPVYLTLSQLRSLPTILIQCQAAAATGPAGGMTTSTTPLPDAPIVLGQVGRLDPQRKYDVLLAIPAEHYMEYSPTLKLYTSRLYFTESRGGVLGANAMQGHNVLFDWQHSRIGFSQSSCEYDLIDPREEKVNYASETYRQGQCVMGPPILTTTCMESLDVAICQASDRPDNVQVLGAEVWTRVIEAPGSDPDSCQRVAKELSLEQKNPNQRDDPFVQCKLDGLCTEERPCQVPCMEVIEYYKTKDEKLDSLKSEDSSNAEIKKGDGCGDNFWSACDFDCKQSRLVSAISNEGICKETSRSSRECHVDACGRTDPCMVPFLVHAILVLETPSAQQHDEWTLSSLERFQEEFTRVSHLPEFSSIAARRRLFNEGDVDVLVVRPWLDDSDLDESDEKFADVRQERPPNGIQLILQVSISNPKVQKISHRSKQRHLQEEEVPFTSRQLLQEVGVLWQNLTQPFRTPKQTFTCNPSDLYPLAKDAVEMANGILEHPDFGARLVEKMAPYTKARVISSWTIGTQVYDDNVNYYGPIAMTPYLLIFRILYETSVIFFFLSLFSCLAQVCHAYRHVCNTVLRRYFGKPGRYLAIETTDSDDDDSLDIPYSPGNKSVASSRSAGSPRDLQSELEMSYVRTMSDSHHRSGLRAVKRHNSLTHS